MALYLHAKKEFESAWENRDHVLEKKNILYTTFTTLKRDIHTRKQVHKMTILSQILKKRRDQNMTSSVDYNGQITEPEEEETKEYQSFPEDCKIKDDWEQHNKITLEDKLQSQKYEQRVVNTEAFDPKKNAKEIKELEMDVSRI